MDGGSGLVESGERGGAEDGEADCVRGGAVRCDECAAVAGAGVGGVGWGACVA